MGHFGGWWKRARVVMGCCGMLVDMVGGQGLNRGSVEEEILNSRMYHSCVISSLKALGESERTKYDRS